MTTTIYSSVVEPFEPKARALIETHPQDDGTDDDNLASSILSSAPKLSSRTNSYSTIPSRNDESWTIREVSNGEEQLYAKGKCVYWTRNSLVIKSFNFTDQVVRAFWSRFDKLDHVCVALVSGLSIFDQIGQHFQILLPFAYQEMYSTDFGIIIERYCDPSQDSSLPVLFALTHPFREVSPIIFKPTPRTSQHTRVLTYSAPNFMTIVGCHDTLPLCLMYNSHENQHSIWRLRKATNEEIDEFNHMNEDSTSNTFAQQSSCSFRDGISHSSLNLSSKHMSSLLQQTNQSSSTATINFSPKLDLRSRKSVLGNLAASRLGAGCGPTVADINATTNLKSFNSAHTFNTMSTPNKNRIINYLRDNIEEPILPELLMEQVWLETSSSSQKAAKFFSTTDLIGDEFMVFVITAACQIKVTKCDKPMDDVGQLHLGRSGTIDGFDAAPITSMKMMVVVDINKNFALYSGFDRLTQISTPQTLGSSVRVLPSSSPASFKHPGLDMSPITMSSARKRSSIGDRSSMGSEYSFNHIFQTLSPVPHAGKHDTKTSSPVTFGDAKRIEYVIGQSVFMVNTNNQRARIEIPTIAQTSYVKRLLDAIKLLVSRDLALSIISKWYQARRASTQADLMSAQEEMQLFKSWFLSSLGVETNLFDVSRDETTELELSVKLVPSVSPSKKSRRARELESNPIIANVHTLLYAMHLVLEDLLLIKLNYEISYSLAELLLVLSCLLKLDEYQGYYWLKFPSIQEKFGNQKAQLTGLINRVESLYRPGFFQSTPPSVVGFVSNIITMSQLNCSDDQFLPYPTISGATNDSFTVVSLFCEMFQVDRSKAVISISPTMTGHSRDVHIASKPERSIKADEKVVELLVELGKDRNYLSRLPEGFNLYLWDAILNCRECPPSNWSEACFDLIGRMDLVNLVCKQTNSGQRGGKGNEKEDETIKLLFPDDIRVSEAHRMLASDTPVEFSIVQRQGATEEESREEVLRHLYLLNVRTMAMPVGRGAICLRTYSPVIGESFEVPRLELSGRALNEDRPVEYNHDITVYPWPFFHNGVSAGLTMCAASANNIIDSTWINYNRPRSNIPHDMRDRDLTAANINNEHAGFLFALGLNGHLEKLSLMALHDYLCQNNDLTKLAILLGMSAAKRGTKDTNIIKVLSIHVDALLPPNSTELDVSASVHAASIIGVGLLYQGSGDSHISRVLLEEIGRLPGPEANSHIDRESYSLSAGLAFGLVNLCRGGSSTISSSDQLRLYMLGGRRKPLSIAQKDRYFKQDCHRGEEEYINTQITSPGGTLGLGLTYHKTSNESVANWMRAPDTQTLLEYVRPDFLILRMLSYGLIMWDEVQPNDEYINSHIPKIVSSHAFQKNHSPVTAKLLLSPTTNSSIDYELVSQAYCNIVTGCCMAMAMRYAGTGNMNAYRTIYKHTKMLIALSNKPTLAEQAGRPCIEACLNVLVTSLAVVMAGTGDLGVMRVCRYLRSRLTQSCIFYGSYMAVHLSLGILFLGACRYSLSASPESIGALVCALYPIYPNHSSDNRYHLQALRHLYVLAVEPRLLIPRDILTNKPVYVNITVIQKNPSNGKQVELRFKAPCLMPEIQTIEKVYVDDERYWRIEINDKKSLIRCLVRDHGYLSVKQKSHSSNNQLVQNIETHILENTTHGAIKCRKSSALSECVKEDRVEQYSALNGLLTRRQKRAPKFRSLLLEQIRLATTLADTNITNKIHLLKPIIGEIETELNGKDTEKAWINYITNVTDWTNTSTAVADYINLNDLKCSAGSGDNELLKSLKELSFGV